MRQKSNSTPASSETLVRNIRRATRKHHAAEEKIRMCSMACAARPQSPRFAGANGNISRRTCTHGQLGRGKPRLGRHEATIA
jgi:hypothetical protein